MGRPAGVHHGHGAQQDREVQHKTMEAIPSTTLRAGLAEAAPANAQLAVAKAVLKTEFCQGGATIKEATARAEDAVEKMARQLVLGQVSIGTKARQHRAKPDFKVLYFRFRSIFDAGKDDGKAIAPGPEQPVQLAMFAL